MGVGVSTTPRPLYFRERPGTHCTGGWVGPTAGLDGFGKSRLPPGFDPRTVQPVAGRYTDCVIPTAHNAHLRQTNMHLAGFEPATLAIRRLKIQALGPPLSLSLSHTHTHTHALAQARPHTAAEKS